MSLTISAAQVDAFIANPTSFSGYSAGGPVIISGSITVAQANSLNSVNATYIKATIDSASATSLAGIATNNSSRTAANQFTVVVNDTSASAATLKSVAAMSSAADFSTIDSITASSAADVIAVYGDSSTTFATDVLIAVNDATVAAADLKAINLLSTKKVTSTATTISGSVADLGTVLATAAGEIGRATDIAVTVTDSVVDALDLVVLDDGDTDLTNGRTTGRYTTGLFTLSTGSTLIGSQAEVKYILGAKYGIKQSDTVPARFTNIKDVNITLDSGTRGTVTPLTAALIGDVIELTNGKVTASTSDVSVATLVTAGSIAGTGHTITVPTITDNSVTAANLKTLDAAITTSLTFDPAGGATAPVITGTASDIKDVFNSSTYSTVLNSSVLTVAGNTTVADANILNSKTTGAITATIADTTMAALASLNDKTGSENIYTISVGDLELDADALVALVDKVKPDANNKVTVSAANTVTGSFDAVHKLLTVAAYTDPLVGAADKAYVITGTNLNVDAAKLVAIDAANDGAGSTTSISSVATITGSSTNVKALYANAANRINGTTGLAGTEAVVVTEATVDSADIITITGRHATNTSNNTAVAGLTTGGLTLGTTVTKVQGSEAEMLVAFESNTPTVRDPVVAPRVFGMESVDIALDAYDSTTLAATNRVKLENYTTGVITANLTAFGSAGAAQISDYINSDGVVQFEAGNKYSFVIKEDAITAAELVNLNKVLAATSGTVTLDPVGGADMPTLEGTAAELAKFFEFDGTIRPATVAASANAIGAKKITITDASIQAADFKAIVAKNGAVVHPNNVVATAVTDVTGSVADIKAVYNGGIDIGPTSNNRIVSGLGAENLTITDFDLSASLLDDITKAASNNDDGSAAVTSANINVIASELSGTTDDCLDNLQAFNDVARFTGLANVDVNLSDTVTTVANVITMNDLTTGTITGEIGTAAALSTFVTLTADTERTHKITLSANDTQVDAAALAKLNSKTDGVIKLTAATSITGSATDVLAAFNAGATEITGLDGNEAVTLTSPATVAEITALESKTSASISATLSDSMVNLLAIAETTNNLTLSVSDSTVKATDLLLLKSKTTGNVRIADNAVVEGTDTELIALVDGITGITNFTNATTSITGGSYTVDKINAVETKLDTKSWTSSIKATVTETDYDELNTLARAGAYTIVLERKTPESAAGAGDNVEKLNASEINAINAKTTEVLTVNTSDHIFGSTDDIKTALEANRAGTITGLGAVKVVGPTGGLTVAEANYIEARTTGSITATIDDGTLSAFINPTTHAILFRSGEAYSFEVTDNDLTATQLPELVLLNAATTGEIFLDPGDGTEATLTGALSDLVAIANGALTAAQIATGGQNGIKGLADAVFTTNDTGVISIADLVVLNGATTGANHIDADSASGLTGTFADAKVIYNGNATFTNDIDDKPLTLTGTITVAEQVLADGYTSGVITASVSDTAANLVSLVDANSNNKITVSITGTTATAADIALVEADTASLVTSTVGTITGNATEIKAAFVLNDGTKLTGLETAAVTISGTPTVADANTISAATTGVVSATLGDTAMATLKTLGETGNAFAVTVADTTVAAADLKTLNSKTTATVTASAATNITGALSDLKSIYEANTAGEITGLGNEVISITDSGEVLAADLHTVNTLNSGVFSANSVTAVKGSVVDLLKVYSSGNTAGVIAGLGNESLIITDTGTVAAGDINTLDGLTTGTITASSVTKLTGSVTEITSARSAATVTGVTSLALTGSTETFDATSYLASNGDLIKAFGNSPASAVTHYLAFGVNESRNLDSFDEKSYLASHADLLTAFGSDTAKATAHYISNGYTENRALDTFDEFGYVASYTDLISALGADATAAVDHYISFGYGEKRTSTFDASSYLSANADLQAAFGSDLEAAKKHYINHGASENRLLA